MPQASQPLEKRRREEYDAAFQSFAGFDGVARRRMEIQAGASWAPEEELKQAESYG